MSTTIELINTGILMGIVHVLTGPDHLSALATLNGMNISKQQHSNNNCDSFLLGIKWGLGHSLGLLVVGGMLIVMEESGSEVRDNMLYIIDISILYMLIYYLIILLLRSCNYYSGSQ